MTSPPTSSLGLPTHTAPSSSLIISPAAATPVPVPHDAANIIDAREGRHCARCDEFSSSLTPPPQASALSSRGTPYWCAPKLNSSRGTTPYPSSTAMQCNGIRLRNHPRLPRRHRPHWARRQLPLLPRRGAAKRAETIHPSLLAPAPRRSHTHTVHAWAQRERWGLCAECLCAGNGCFHVILQTRPRAAGAAGVGDDLTRCQCVSHPWPTRDGYEQCTHSRSFMRPRSASPRLIFLPNLSCRRCRLHPPRSAPSSLTLTQVAGGVHTHAHLPDVSIHA
ncbi:hypothetical protein C8R46DRAFT_311893 [Mycena filopes]|nr:hypothetical protein C8R46DRAFT_311893 [Mycena filopes]